MSLRRHPTVAAALLLAALAPPLALLALLPAGCETAGGKGGDRPAEPPPPEPEPFEKEVEAQLGSIGAPRVREGGPSLAGDLIARGRPPYAKRCATCHGPEGGGDGKAARMLSPKPRDFRYGVFKWKSTPMGVKPTRADLVHASNTGPHAGIMKNVSAAEREAIAAFVTYLAIRGELRRRLVYYDENDDEVTAELAAEEAADLRDAWLAAEGSVVDAEPPEELDDPARVARGRALFLDPAKANCASCHGETGKGDGPEAGKQKDVWGRKVKPFDLTRKDPQGGGRPIDLYRRIACGVAGTSMPSFDKALEPAQIWDIVAFVRSLRAK